MNTLTDLNPDALQVELAYRRALLGGEAAGRFRAHVSPWRLRPSRLRAVLHPSGGG